ncbi:MAG: hypothetical protein MI974_14360 [Chitinophagales bacterium]|nr:hypothetical protein [Chitinophagales bacterium]
MKALLLDKDNTIDAIIGEATNKDMPLKKNGWQFTWKSLFRTKGALFYKLTTIEYPTVIEGVIMLTLINEEILYMNCIEVAPHNYGSIGKYKNVAGALLAYGCYKSFELGKNHYLGFLSFDSKTQLIKLYQKKYGATIAAGHKMFFTPQAGKKLMKKYLLI